MGANAQTSVPTFTAGEVLTAANMNISARTGVPVFATTTTRDAAFGGTGEKTLAEGQLCYLESTNVVQYYDGTSWATVGPATVSSGLTVVVAETDSSAVQSVTHDSVFTSTYTDYLLNLRWQQTTNTGSPLYLQFRASGSTTATNYNYQYVMGRSTTASAAVTASSTSIVIGGSTEGAFWNHLWVHINGPQLAAPTLVTVLENNPRAAYTTPDARLVVCNQSDNTAFDGFFLDNTSTNTFNIRYTLYGYAKS